MLSSHSFHLFVVVVVVDDDDDIDYNDELYRLQLDFLCI